VRDVLDPRPYGLADFAQRRHLVRCCGHFEFLLSLERPRSASLRQRNAGPGQTRAAIIPGRSDRQTRIYRKAGGKVESKKKAPGGRGV
jgi:hypothetical protein